MTAGSAMSGVKEKGDSKYVTMVNGKINSTKDTDSKPWIQKMNEEKHRNGPH